MGSISEEQERVRNLLLDTVTLLCKNGLSFKKQLKVQGLLGITMDEDNVFIVHIDEKVGDVTVEHQKQDSKKHNNTGSENAGSKDSNTYEGSPERHKSRKRSSTSSPVYKGPPEKVKIKTEHFDDDLMLLDDKSSIPKVTSVHSANYNATSSGDMNNYGQYNQTMPNQYASMPTAFVSGVAPNASQLTEAPQGAGGSADKFEVGNFTDARGYYSSFTNASFHKPARDRNSLEKPFKCDFPHCGRSYFNKKHLNRHKRQKHLMITSVKMTPVMSSRVDREQYSLDGADEGEGLTKNTSEQHETVAGINDSLNSSETDTDIILTNSSIVDSSQAQDVSETGQCLDDTQFSSVSGDQGTSTAAGFEFEYLLEN